MGGEWFDDLGDEPDNISTNDIIRIALDSLEDHMGVSDEPSNVVAQIHKVGSSLFSIIIIIHVPHTVVLIQNCIAQYRLGHSDKLGKCIII